MKSSSFLRVLSVVGLLTPLLIAACDDDDPTPSGPPGTSGRGGGGNAGRGGAAGMGTAGMGTAGMGTAGMGTAGTNTAGAGVSGSSTAGAGGGSGAENTNAACKDGVDNDGNSFTDCKDFGCQYFPVTGDVCSQAGEATDEQCQDDLDNDGDGFINCEDFSCSKNPNVTVCDNAGGSGGTSGSGGGGAGGGSGAENSDAACKDGVDNDGNGFTDCKDFSCRYFPVTAAACPEAGEATDDACQDGQDNDGDGFSDCKDFSCSKSPNVTVCDNTGGSGGASGSGGAGGAGGGAAGAGGKGGGGGGGGGSGGGKVVINELFFNSKGDPDKFTYIELKGPPGSSLEGFQLLAINGNGGAEYKAFPFTGPNAVVGPNGYVVVMEQGEEVAVPEGTTVFSAAPETKFSIPDLQNGPDNLILVDASGSPLDAIGYSSSTGVFNTPVDVFLGEGEFALSPISQQADLGYTLSRLPNGFDSQNNRLDFRVGLPTPGSDNVEAPPLLKYFNITLLVAMVSASSRTGVNGL